MFVVPHGSLLIYIKLTLNPVKSILINNRRHNTGRKYDLLLLLAFCHLLALPLVSEYRCLTNIEGIGQYLVDGVTAPVGLAPRGRDTFLGKSKGNLFSAYSLESKAEDENHNQYFSPFNSFPVNIEDVVVEFVASFLLPLGINPSVAVGRVSLA